MSNDLSEELGGMLQGMGFSKLTDGDGAQLWASRAQTELSQRIDEMAERAYVTWCRGYNCDPWDTLDGDTQQQWRMVAIEFYQGDRLTAEDIGELAAGMFDAYNKQAEGKTYNGLPIPPWQEIGERVQNCWRAAANYAAERLSR